jgi:hypothetical protein
MSLPQFRHAKNRLDYGARATRFPARNRPETFDRADEARSEAPESQRREEAKRQSRMIRQAVRRSGMPTFGMPDLGSRCFIGSALSAIDLSTQGARDESWATPQKRLRSLGVAISR